MPLTNLRILVAEDEYFIAMELGHVLGDAGATVIGPVACAADAAALLSPEPDIALLDIKLAGESCFDLADILAAKRIPFVFVTGYDRHTIPARFASAPFVQKPATREELIGALMHAASKPTIESLAASRV
jgi:two-component SAPR family response regulator